MLTDIDRTMIRSLRLGASKAGQYIQVQRAQLRRLITLLEEGGVVESDPEVAAEVARANSELPTQQPVVPATEASSSTLEKADFVPASHLAPTVPPTSASEESETDGDEQEY